MLAGGRHLRHSVAYATPEQNQESLYKASFDAPCHPMHNGKAHVPRRLMKELRTGVFSYLPL
jgi:hypothetical protein